MAVGMGTGPVEDELLSGREHVGEGGPAHPGETLGVLGLYITDDHSHVAARYGPEVHRRLPFSGAVGAESAG
ncbi:hypothetical protein GCM10018791_43060 [Streptomyces zaomyceticus]|nr:hypothetical protein GCM10018791_43060 [Streptomyces zaomyceticus]